MLKKETNLRRKLNMVWEEQDKERKRTTNIIELLEFLHPKYYDLYFNNLLTIDEQKELFEEIRTDEYSLQIFCENVQIEKLCSILLCIDDFERVFEHLPEESLEKVLDFMEVDGVWYIFEQLLPRQKIKILLLLDHEKIEAFLCYGLEEGKLEYFFKWLSNSCSDKTENEMKMQVKSKIFNSIVSMVVTDKVRLMQNDDKTLLQSVPSFWLDEVLELIMTNSEIVTLFAGLSNENAIEILIHCNDENFYAICQNILTEVGGDFFCYEDVSTDNQIDFLKRLKKSGIEVTKMFTFSELAHCYKAVCPESQKVILYDMIANFEEEIQKEMLKTLYNLFDKQEKLEFLEMISDDEGETKNFIAKKIIAIRMRGILDSCENLKTFEKIFLNHFETWLKDSFLNKK